MEKSVTPVAFVTWVPGTHVKTVADLFDELGQLGVKPLTAGRIPSLDWLHAYEVRWRDGMYAEILPRAFPIHQTCLGRVEVQKADFTESLSLSGEEPRISHVVALRLEDRKQAIESIKRIRALIALSSAPTPGSISGFAFGRRVLLPLSRGNEELAELLISKRPAAKRRGKRHGLWFYKP